MTENSPTPSPDDPDTSALDRASESIDDAKGALSGVAADGDVTTGDDQVAGVGSQDPGQAAESADAITSQPDSGPNPERADPDAG